MKKLIFAAIIIAGLCLGVQAYTAYLWDDHTIIGGLSGTSGIPLKVDSDGTVNVSLGSGSSAVMSTLTVTGAVKLATTSGNVGIGTTAPARLLDINGTSNFAGIIKTNGNYISGDGGVEGISINNNGNVGIGTTGPAAKLEVNGLLKVDSVNTGGTEVGTALFIGSDGQLCLTGQCK